MCILWLESTAYRYIQVRDVIHFEPNSTLARVYSLPPGFDSSRQVLTRQRQRDSLFALLLHALRRHLCSVPRCYCRLSCIFPTCLLYVSTSSLILTSNFRICGPRASSSSFSYTFPYSRTTVLLFILIGWISDTRFTIYHRH
ncbi:hypothetical protein FOBRF1_005781 [Fusarium oxysporum]